jgi:hypothetical protein
MMWPAPVEASVLGVFGVVTFSVGHFGGFGVEDFVVGGLVVVSFVVGGVVEVSPVVGGEVVVFFVVGGFVVDL